MIPATLSQPILQSPLSSGHSQFWQGDPSSLVWGEAEIRQLLLQLDQSLFVVRWQGQVGVTQSGAIASPTLPGQTTGQAELLATLPPLPLQNLGDSSFLTCHRTSYAYMAGAMAGGIASEEMVIALGRAGLMGSMGTGGLSLERVEGAIAQIQQALPHGPYAFNLLHNPHDQAAERAVVDLYLKYGVRTVEASAFLALTPNIVYYRVAGLQLNAANQIEVHNRVIAKVSRQEVASKFMRPAPERILKDLVEQGLITSQQAQLAQSVPMADDITVEADSGGHTDNRPLVCILPGMIAIRDQIQAEQNYGQPVRIGAAGGIATPEAVLGAFMMGAAYVVTGSINQSCVEAGTSDHTKELLTKAEMADVTQAPAADMFEDGVKVQVLKKGTFFPMRAQKLYEIYRAYEAIADIPPAEREKIEKQVLQQSFDAAWQEVADYLSQRNPAKLERASKNPKLQMALIFRRYLGLSSRWARNADPARKMDYQIWCGPAMGAFNEWVRGSHLQPAAQRQVVEVGHQLLVGAAYNYRIQTLSLQGIRLPAALSAYRPLP